MSVSVVLRRPSPVLERLLIAVLFLVLGSISYFGLGLPLHDLWPWYSALVGLFILALITHHIFFNPHAGQQYSKSQMLDSVIGSLRVVAWSMNARGAITGVYGCGFAGGEHSHADHKGLCTSLHNKTIVNLSASNPQFASLAHRALGGEVFEEMCDVAQRSYRHVFTPRFRYGANDGFDCVSTESGNSQDLSPIMQLWEQTFANSADAAMVLDNKRMVCVVNKAFTEITGFTEPDALGKRDNLLLCKPPGENYYHQLFDELKHVDSWNGEVVLRHKSSHLFTVNMTMNALRDTEGEVRHYLALFSDVSHTKQTEEELRHLANHDTLTGLPNRRLFLDRIEQNLLRAHRNRTLLAVLFLDIDNFKLVNDAYGHDAGDIVLKEIAVRLGAAMRESDTVARLAGDEFTVIADNISDYDEATSIAKKVLACFDNPFELPDQALEVSASIGIAVYPDDGNDFSELIKSADQAMYKAKAEGRNGFYSLSGQRPAQVEQGKYYPSELRLAVKRGQMKIVYQPQLALSDGHLIGYESLLRWDHHCRGNIGPTDFMAVSEEAGITESLGYWTVDTVAGQLSRWRDTGNSVDYISVNIAMSQIKASDFPAMVQEILSQHHLPMSSLMLEITEEDCLRNMVVCKQFFTQLRQIGIRSCIDQFGAYTDDYSYIKDLSVETVKINQKTLAKSHLGHSDPSFFYALIALCKVLNKSVIAVGVERTTQESQLRNVGCYAAQGYLYGQPMTADEAYNHYVAITPGEAVD